jgi:arylsulfatase A-like enzyme
MDRRTFLRLTGSSLALGALGAGAQNNQANARRPNIILIMTDNQGAWTLGCYGNSDIHTPNIDRLAHEGVRFTRAFCNNAVCSPTRASYLTGLMPSQHGVHKYINNDVMLGPKAYSTIEEFDTLPQILSSSGYTCGLVGKWHLGDHLRPQEGFSYWVAKPEGHTTGFHNQKYIENGETHEIPGHQTAYWTERASDFIEQNREEPFFLFLAYNGPYGLGKSMLTEPDNPHSAEYAASEFKSFPREQSHPWLHNNRDMINNPTSMRSYASELSCVDDGVGEVLDTLSRLGLEKDTLIIFTADQGWAGGQGGFWGMGDHTRPLTAYDPMMHIPLIFRQPGRIPEGVEVDSLVSNYDLLPSVLHYLGMQNQIPSAPPPPGRNYAPFLRGETVDWDDVVFFEFENLRAIRTADWKYIERFGDAPDELYDVQEDPSEEFNLVNSANHRGIREELRGRLRAFFDRYADPTYDLWNGGTAKGGLLLGADPYEPRRRVE